MSNVWSDRLGLLLVAGGVLFFLSFASQIFIASPEVNGEVVNLPLYWLYNALMAVGVVLLALGVWGIRDTVGATIGQVGRVGTYLCIASFVFYLLTALLAAVEAGRTGRPPDIFVFVGLALVLSVVGPLLLGIGLRHVDALGATRFLPFLVLLGALLAFVPVDPWHDIGLAVFSLAWVALGGGWGNTNPGTQ